MSSLEYGRVLSERPQVSEPSPVVPLLVLVLALAVATMWFVVLPALDKPAGRTCEVVFLTGGTTRCIEPPVPGMRATPPGATSGN